MKQLINSNFHYYFGKILSFLSSSLAVFGIFAPFEKFYYNVYNYHEIRIGKEILREDPVNIDITNWRGHKIILYENGSVSIQDRKGKIVVWFSYNQRLANKINNHLKDYDYNKMLDKISI